MITVLRVKYTGAQDSCLLVADASGSTLTASIGALGAEAPDVAFGTAGVIDLTGLTVEELAAAIDAYATYEASVTSGDETVSAEVITSLTAQAAGIYAYLLFEPVTTLGTDALVSWETIRTFLGTATDPLGDDDRLYAEQLINAASVRANTITKRKLASRTYTGSILDGPGTDVILLPEYPVTDVEEILIDGAREFGSGTEVDEYYLYEDGRVYVPAGIPRARLSVKVTYTAGYDPVPYDLQHAIIEAVAYNWKRLRSRALGTRSISAEGVTTQYEIDIPLPAMRVIESYGRGA